jgi:hypothetical protein
MLLLLALARMVYPFELEWTEGAFLDQVYWISSGRFPYQPPTLEFLPLTYTPIYFYLAAGAAKIFGTGFFAPRLVSVLATVGVLALSFLLVQSATGSKLFAWLSTGLFAASYRFTGAWLDLAKTDSLFLLLVMLAYWVYRSARQRAQAGGSLLLTWVFSGTLFALAYFTKQTTLPVVIALSPVSLLAWRGRSWPVWAWAAALAGGAFVLLDRLSLGWFSYYTLDALAYHARLLPLGIFWGPLLKRMAPAMLLAALSIPLAAARLRKNPGSIVFFTWRSPGAEPPPADSLPLHLSPVWEDIAFTIALILASWSVFFKTWTYDNGFLPASLGLSLLAGMVAGWWQTSPMLQKLTSAEPLRRAAPLFLIIIQFTLLAYDPRQQLPTASHRAAGERLLQDISELPGEVWVFQHSYLSRMAGKASFFHAAPMGDYLGAAQPPAGSDDFERRQQIAAVFEQALRAQTAQWVIVDKLADFWQPAYIPVKELGEDSPEADFRPLTGAVTRPSYILARNLLAQEAHLALAGNIDFRLFLASKQSQVVPTIAAVAK